MKLLEPCTIGSMELKNRIVMAPMSCNMTHDFQVTDDLISFFEERARGGTGLITIGDGIVDVPRGNNVKGSLAIDDDRYVTGLRRLARAMQKHGAKTVMQLSHGGRRSGRVARSGYLEVSQGLIPVAPSVLPHPVPGQVVPMDLSKEAIKELLKKFKHGARRAMEAGFDALGLHCAHMYLCGQFLSPWSNRRRDDYGGELPSRLRFVLEAIEAIKAVTGSHLPLIVRMNGEEPPGGNSLEEIGQIAHRLETAGIDAIHVSVGYGSPSKDIDYTPSITPMRSPEGCIVHLAENIKKFVAIPVIAVNKLGDITVAEGVLQEQKADMIAMGRPLIADPFLPLKAASGRYKDIRPCIYCNEGCIKNVLENDAPIACSVNPEAGLEGQKPALKGKVKKKILVVGAGPAGLQCAISAEQAGHDVSLFESSEKIGGDLLLASVPVGKQAIENFRLYLLDQLESSRVNVFLEQEVTQDWLDTIRPDIAVLATGARPILPQIKGLSAKDCFLPADVLGEKDVPGKRVAIIGGGAVGCELAEYLSKQGKEVTVIELEDDIARDKERINRLSLINALEKLGVRIMTRTIVLEASRGSLHVESLSENESIPTDSIIAALGKKPVQDRTDDMIRSRVPDCFLIGDKAKTRGILDAVKEGYMVVQEF